MSMWLNLVKLAPAELERVKAKPDLLENVFFDDGEVPLAGYSEETDVFGTDYRTLSAIAEAMEDGESLEDQESWLAKSAGNGIGDDVDYEFTYGSAYALSPDEVKQIAAGFAAEAWYAEIADDDDDENLPGLVRFFATAAKEGKGIIGGVS